MHLKWHPEFHPYLDASKAGLKAVSDGRAAYQRSVAHTEAYEAARATTCLPAVYGAPGPCFGLSTPHHILARSKAGGLEAADAYPVVPACERHNAAIQDSIDTREWAIRTYFTLGNRQFPFLITDAWLTAEREGVRL